ncbi:hypothetical protein CBS101457_002112 [Exobasidium rhododendri]|nr:hypothetical protein CBS101457_002112 [Exobasidium rhododendri]
MSWPPTDQSDAKKIVGRIYASGLPMITPSSDEQQQQQLDSGNRPRLPPLSSLISSSFPATSSAASGKLSSPSSRHDWSPMSSHNAPLSHSRSSPFSDNVGLQRSNAGDSPSSIKAPRYLQRYSHEHPSGLPRHVQSGSDYASSSSSSAAPSVTLPSMSTFSDHSEMRSPPSSSNYVSTGSALHPLRLPSTASASSPLPLYAANPSSDQSRYRRNLDSPPSSTSANTAGVGPIRRRWTGGPSPTRPYERPVSPSRSYSFGHLWSIYSYACRINDEESESTRQSHPSISEGDVKTLLYYLNRELDRLETHTPRMSLQLAQEAGLVTSERNEAANTLPSLMSSSSLLPPSSSRRFHRSRTLDGSDHRSDLTETYAGLSREGDVDMLSSSHSYNSPPLLYHGGVPGSSGSNASGNSNIQRSRTGDGMKPSYLQNINRSPLLTSPMVSQTYRTTPPPMNALASSSSSSMLSNAPAGSNLPPKRVRKRRDEADQSCLSCSATETPEWRKGPTGPRTLCNACGLLFAKQCRKKETDAQARGERPRGSRPSAPEIMTAEEKERSLIELKIAVNARTNLSPI